MSLGIPSENEAQYNSLNDKIIDLYGFFNALAAFTAPLIGDLLYSYVQDIFYTFNITALLNVLFALFMIVFNCGANFRRTNFKFEHDLSMIQSKVKQGEAIEIVNMNHNEEPSDIHSLIQKQVPSYHEIK